MHNVEEAKICRLTSSWAARRMDSEGASCRACARIYWPRCTKRLKCLMALRLFGLRMLTSRRLDGLRYAAAIRAAISGEIMKNEVIRSFCSTAGTNVRAVAVDRRGITNIAPRRGRHCAASGIAAEEQRL